MRDNGRVAIADDSGPSGINELIRQDWRELGFFCDRDDEARAWKLTGSREGLLRFRDLLFAYVAYPGNAAKSEHEHYGPYMSIEVMTWPEAGFDDHAIRGPLTDLARLARLIEAKLAAARSGSSVRIQDEFAADSPYAIVLDVRDDEFDPATADPWLPAEGASHPATQRAAQSTSSS
jgi:hypothetical protein